MHFPILLGHFQVQNNGPKLVLDLLFQEVKIKILTALLNRRCQNVYNNTMYILTEPVIPVISVHRVSSDTLKSIRYTSSWYQTDVPTWLPGERNFY